MHIGFTGTQHGMTEHQKQEVQKVLEFNRRSLHVLIALHGDCIGADAEFDKMCHELDIPVWLYPANDVLESQRAHCKDYQKSWPGKPALQRNHDIVLNSDVMIAAPFQDHEIQRSGTWATIRYAKHDGKIIHIIYPKDK